LTRDAIDHAISSFYCQVVRSALNRLAADDCRAAAKNQQRGSVGSFDCAAEVIGSHIHLLDVAVDFSRMLQSGDRG
jgi:hypothetical protein